METTVNILVTCRSKEMLPAALLVFKTLRVGFPTAGVTVFGNGLGAAAHQEVQYATKLVGGTFLPLPQAISHGQWIEEILDWGSRGLWICDTDVVFFDEVERWFEPMGETLFAGRLEPAFNCDWTKATHVARLHPSLMFLNPARLRPHMRGWPNQDKFFNSVQRNLVQWHWVAQRERVLEGQRRDQERLFFYDTCAGLHHALGGTEFTAAQNTSFEHLYSGTYLDLIKASMPPGFAELHEAVYADPQAARGIWKKQQQWYKEKTI